MIVIVIAESTHDQFHTHKREEERGKKRQQGFDATPAVMEPYILSLLLSVRSHPHGDPSDDIGYNVRQRVDP